MNCDFRSGFGADPRLPLTHGLGTALCVASSLEHEPRRHPDKRLALVREMHAVLNSLLTPIRHVSFLIFVGTYTRFSILILMTTSYSFPPLLLSFRRFSSRHNTLYYTTILVTTRRM